MKAHKTPHRIKAVIGNDKYKLAYDIGDMYDRGVCHKYTHGVHQHCILAGVWFVRRRLGMVKNSDLYGIRLSPI